MKYRANPITVEAFKIVCIPSLPTEGNHLNLELENGETVKATYEMVCRLNNGVATGDYWVIQEDGYVYLNPKEVFERKYSPIDETAA